MIHESHLDDDNVTWTAAIHTNTDNIHIHVAVVELEKVERKYDKLETRAFDKLKSRVANSIINDMSKKEELSQIFQIELPDQIRETVHVTGEQIENLIHVLPSDIPWQYNRPGMAQYRSFIDDCVTNIITSNKAIESRFTQGLESLARYQNIVREMYGTGKHDRSDDAVDNKLKDFYARAGNALLSEAKKSRGLYRSEPEPQPAGEESAVTYSEDSGNPFDDYDIPPEQEPPVFYDDDSVLPGESEYISGSESGLAGEKNLSSLDKLLDPAEKGSSFAQYKLAQLYYYGKDGLPEDQKKHWSCLRSRLIRIILMQHTDPQRCIVMVLAPK
jgi:hypothetical protein